MSLCGAAEMNTAARLLGRLARLMRRVLSARGGQNGRRLDGTQSWQHPQIARWRAGSHARAAARSNMNIGSYYPSRAGGHFLQSRAKNFRAAGYVRGGPLTSKSRV